MLIFVPRTAQISANEAKESILGTVLFVVSLPTLQGSRLKLYILSTDTVGRGRLAQRESISFGNLASTDRVLIQQ